MSVMCVSGTGGDEGEKEMRMLVVGNGVTYTAYSIVCLTPQLSHLIN